MPEELDKIDALILEAISQGKVKIPEEILDAVFDAEPEYKMSEAASGKMLDRLQAFAKEKHDVRKKIENPGLLNHFGEYLSLFLLAKKVDRNQFAEDLEIDMRKMEGLEKGKLPPTEIDVEKMASLLRRIELGWNSAKTLLLNSYKLQFLEPGKLGALARYDTKKKSSVDRNKSMVSSALKHALKRLNLPESNEQEINGFLDAVEKVYKSG